ncbi:NAD(P)/FAD-dependent oxidoreductase [Hirschia litorea]|uniref:NAD(P)/FAD-dependent oxidoreductase n=1 Tax=Hirschia litorea TaxID=1199156 RepID=A0ABW2IGI6_9PROT
MCNRVVIVGGGQAGAQATMSLRQWGYEGEIILLSEEEHLPYQRPPLSKAYMKGEMSEERLYLKQSDWYEQHNVSVQLSTAVEAIDRTDKTVLLDNGKQLSFDRLILATGSRPRNLSMDDVEGLGNIFTLRGMKDVTLIKPLMKAGQKLVILGAGYIGLEAAAVARQLELDVTVLEMAPRILARVTGPEISAFYTAEHSRQGVDIKTHTALKTVKGLNGSISSIILDDDTELQADLLLVGIGVLPNEELAKDAGILCDNGIVVDEDACTSDPNVYAIGDCARRPLVHYSRTGRLESVHNAIEQGKLAAASILGRDRPKEECPWFWSDQYDLKLQIAGLSQGYDETVVRGNLEERKFAVFYLKNGQLLAVDAVNAAPEFLVAKKLIPLGIKLEPHLLGDVSVSMKEFLPK